MTYLDTISGIYQIKNLVNSKVYIGSSSNIYQRWANHKSSLNNNKHHCIHLQNSFNKYGENTFEFNILHKVPHEYCLKIEQFYFDRGLGEYNICRVAGGNGSEKRKLTDKAILEIFLDYSNENYTIEQLSIKYNLGKQGIHKILTRQTYNNIKISKKLVEKVNKILKMGISKGSIQKRALSDIQISYIKTCKISAKQLSKKFKVSISVIYRAKQNHYLSDNTLKVRP